MSRTLLRWLISRLAVRAAAKCSGANASCWPGADAWKNFSKGLEGEFLTRPQLLPSLSWHNAVSLGNPLVQHQPAVVVLATSHDDVVKTVQFAYEHELLLSVKSTGSCWTGNCLLQDSLHLDLGKINAIDINAALRTAKLGPGTNFKQVYEAVDKQGLLAVGGMCNRVGPVGFSLGGGHGPLVRSFGLGADNLVEIVIVLANGTSTIASKQQNKDLFWALRGGGGGTFGIVTSLTVQLHEAPPSLMSMSCAWPLFDGNATPGVAALEEWFTEIQPKLDEKWSFFTIVNKKPIPGFMQLPWTKTMDGLFSLEGLYFGPQSNESMEAVRNVLDLRSESQLKCTFDVHKSFVQWHDSRWFTVQLPFIRTAMASTFLTKPQVAGRPLAQIIGQHIQALDQTALTMFYGFTLGGAVSRVSAEEASAVSPAFRSASMVIESVSTWFRSSQDREQLDWTRNMGGNFSMLAGAEGSYLNEALADLSDFPTRFWGSNYVRLQRTKSAVDPQDVFSCTQCVKGAGAQAFTGRSKALWV